MARTALVLSLAVALGSPAGVAEARTCNPSQPFGDVRPVLSGSLAGSFDGIALTRDALTGYFSRRNGKSYDLYTGRRSSSAGAFRNLSLLGSVSSAADDSRPALLEDGAKLLFGSRNTATNDWDLFLATRRGAAFGPAAAVPELNSSADDRDPFFSEIEQALYFSSHRASGAQRDLYRSPIVGGTFETPVPLKSVNSVVYDDDYPVLSRDGLTLYFSSKRTYAGDNDGDLWLATRPDTFSDFEAPANLTALNTSGKDFPLALSADACTLYFASNRETGLGATPVYRLYSATRGAAPRMVTVKLSVSGGSGSVSTAPFHCRTWNAGTCSVEVPAGSVLSVNASGPASWSGDARSGFAGVDCKPNGPNPSTDASITVTESGTCNVAFP